MKNAALLVSLVFAGWLIAADLPKPSPPDLKVEQKAEILKAQVKLQRFQLQATSLSQQLNQEVERLQQQYQRQLDGLRQAQQQELQHLQAQVDKLQEGVAGWEIDLNSPELPWKPKEAKK